MYSTIQSIYGENFTKIIFENVIDTSVLKTYYRGSY